MKKFLLAVAAAMTLTAANAEVITLSPSNATDVVGTTTDNGTQPLESLKIGGYSFSFTTSEDAQTMPALWSKDNTIRVYAGTAMTVTAPEAVNAIVFTASKADNLKGIGDNNHPTTTAGTIEVGTTTITWNANSATSTTIDFISDDANKKYPNFKISSITVYTGSDQPGESGGTEPPAGDATTGTKEKPLTVAEFIALGVPSAAVANTYVKGYIVGYLSSTSIDSYVFGTAEGALYSNILLADSRDCTDINAAIPVQMPSGSVVRSACNLGDNPDNLFKVVSLCGNRDKYFSVAGLKEATWYEFEGEEGPGQNIPCATVADLLALKNLSTFVFEGELTVAYANGPDCYVYDATGATLLYSSKNDPWATVLEPGTLITSFSGTRNDYKTTNEFIPVMSTLATESGEGEPYAKTVKTASEFDAIAVDTYVMLENVTVSISEENERQATATFADNSTVALWNRFNGDSYNPKPVYPSEGNWNVFGLRSVNSGEVSINFVKADDASGIEEVVVADARILVVGNNIIAPADAHVYSINGVEVGTNNLANGVYVVRTANTAVKVIVK